MRGGPSRVRRSPLLLFAATSLLVLGACSDQPVSPAGPDAIGAADGASFHRDGGGHHGRRGKYRDSRPHATGRSGTATLEGQALLGAGGVTSLTITTGDLDDPSTARGHIAKAQVKVRSAACTGGTPGGDDKRGNGHRKGRGNGHDHHGGDGDEGCWRTLNFNGLTQPTVTLPLTGLQRGDSIRVQANVRGIDGRRTDVVTLWLVVGEAPALNVDLQAPPEVRVGVPIPVSATVTELNGDAGAWADCKLYADGVLVDEAPSIWVDAGDAVTCLFTYTPTRPGAQNLEARVTPSGGTPSSSLTSGDTDTETVVAVDPATPTFSATAEDRTVRGVSVLQYHWEKPDGSFKEYSNTETTLSRTQNLSVTGGIGRAVTFPLARVELQYGPAGVWHAESWDDVAGAPEVGGATCVRREMPEQGSMFHLCTTGASTSFGYTRFAGTATYRANGFVRQFWVATGEGGNDGWNDEYTTYSAGGQVRPWGAVLPVSIRVTDAQGTFGVSPVISLQPFDRVISSTPRACELIYHYWLDGNAQEQCTSAETRESGFSGQVTG